MVSHDERLIAAATELWVCDGRQDRHNGGLRLEKGGFQAYRRQRIATIEAKAVQVARDAALRAQKRLHARRERIAKLAVKRNGSGK